MHYFRLPISRQAQKNRLMAQCPLQIMGLDTTTSIPWRISPNSSERNAVRKLAIISRTLKLRDAMLRFRISARSARSCVLRPLPNQHRRRQEEKNRHSGEKKPDGAGGLRDKSQPGAQNKQSAPKRE